MTAPGTLLLRDVRGAAIYVEFLIVAPLLALLWMFANYAHRLGESQVQVQRRARECAWSYAASGCRDAAVAGCELDGPSRLGAAELDRIAGSGLESVVRPIHGLSSLFPRSSGDEFVARTRGAVSRLPFLGGSAATSGTDRMLCNDRVRAPRLPEVVDRTCRGLLGSGGRCP